MFLEKLKPFLQKGDIIRVSLLVKGDAKYYAFKLREVLKLKENDCSRFLSNVSKSIQLRVIPFDRFRSKIFAQQARYNINKN